MAPSHKRKVVGLIPLRGGSRAIPYKNIKPMAGKPLAYWVAKAAAEARNIDEVYVSTDDPQIKEAVTGFGLGLHVVDRPKELADDKTTTDAVMLHFMEQVPDFDTLITLQATSPLTSAEHIDEALEQFDAGGHDSMLTGVRSKRFVWHDNGTPHNYDYRNRPMRQDFPGSIVENGAFYITKKEILEREKNRLGGNIGIYVMPEVTEVELDEPEDWAHVERHLLGRNGE